MNTNKLFIEATKRHIRFQFKGSLTVEQLWELTPEELNSMYQKLRAEQKKETEDTLLTTTESKDENLDISIEIIKYIVKDKLDERERQQKAKEIKEQKQKLLAVLAQKEDAALNEKSIDEIRAMIENLG